MKSRLVDGIIVLLLIMLPVLGISQACGGKGPVTPPPNGDDNHEDGDNHHNPPNHAPVAMLSIVGPEEGPTPFTAQLDGSGSYDPDGDPLQYNWIFSDGTQANESVVTHEFKSSGRHYTKLVVNDNRGLADDADTATFYGWGIANSPWPKFAHDERNSGTSRHAGPMMDLERADRGGAFPRYWRTGIQDAPVSAVCVGYDGLVIYAQGPWLRARTENGIPLWEKEFDSDITAWPAFAYDGSIVLATFGGWAYRLSSQGDRIWSINLSYVIGGPMALGIAVNIGYDGTIYIPGALMEDAIPYAERGRLIALTFDGAFRWTRVIPHFQYECATAITPDGDILVNGERGWLFTPDGDVIAQMEFRSGADQTLVGLGIPTVNPQGFAVFNCFYLPLFVATDKLYMAMTDGEDPGTRQAAVWGVDSVSQVTCEYPYYTLNTRTIQGDLHKLSFTITDDQGYNVSNPEIMAGSAEDSLGRTYISCGGLRAISPFHYSSLYPYAVRRYSLWTYERPSYTMTPPAIGEDGWLYLGYGNDILAIGD